MFENKTYGAVLKGMLETLPERLDKREGSVVFDSLAPAALEISRVYATLDVFLNLGFLTSAHGSYLDLKAAENGVYRFSPTKAILKIEVFGYEDNVALEKGSRLYCEKNSLYYTVLEAKGEGIYCVECAAEGTAGNINSGRFTPTSTVLGFNYANYESTEKYGENGEGDDALRTRCLQKMGQVAAEGNIAEYHKKAEEFGGIGRIKVNPTGDAVKIYLLDSENTLPQTSLIESFQAYLDPDSEGLGMGAAPIGAKIIVLTPEIINITVQVNVKLIAGAGIDTVKNEVEQVIHQMIKENAFLTDEFSYFNLASKLLTINGVLSIVSVTLNGGTVAVRIPEYAVPVLTSCQVVTS